MSWARGLTGEGLEELNRVLNRENYGGEAKRLRNHKNIPAGTRQKGKKVLLIQTGGTIDKDYPRKTKGYAFQISDPAVHRILAKANLDLQFKTVTACRKDSTEITKADRLRILQLCMRSPANHILVTHGTDTMIETAQLLGQAQKWRKGLSNKVIVLTGAMKPERFVDSDAAFNIGAAICALETCKPGVYVCMNGRPLRCDTVGRDKVSGRFISKL